MSTITSGGLLDTANNNSSRSFEDEEFEQITLTDRSDPPLGWAPGSSLEFSEPHHSSAGNLSEGRFEELEHPVALLSSTSSTPPPLPQQHSHHHHHHVAVNAASHDDNSHDDANNNNNNQAKPPLLNDYPLPLGSGGGGFASAAAQSVTSSSSSHARYSSSHPPPHHRHSGSSTTMPYLPHPAASSSTSSGKALLPREAALMDAITAQLAQLDAPFLLPCDSALPPPPFPYRGAEGMGQFSATAPTELKEECERSLNQLLREYAAAN